MYFKTVCIALLYVWVYKVAVADMIHRKEYKQFNIQSMAGRRIKCNEKLFTLTFGLGFIILWLINIKIFILVCELVSETIKHDAD